MKRFTILLGAALVGCAVLPQLAQAQVVFVQPRSYAPPVVVQSYYPPSYYVAPSVTTYSAPVSPSYSYYPPLTTYYAAPTTVYSAPATVYTYSPPATFVTPRPGVYETRTYYGYGIFRPRGYYTETRYYP